MKMKKGQNWKRFSFISSCFASICISNLADASFYYFLPFFSFLFFRLILIQGITFIIITIPEVGQSSRDSEGPGEKRNEEKGPWCLAGNPQVLGKRRGELPSSSFVGTIETKGENWKENIKKKKREVLEEKKNFSCC